MDITRDAASDATELRSRGLRVTGPRLAILAMLEQVGGHRSADELVIALRQGGYHHARTTVYNALDDLARAGMVRSAPVDAGALRYEITGEDHHHFVCRSCGRILNVPIAPDLAQRPAPTVEGGKADEVDVIYRGLCAVCEAAADSGASAGEDVLRGPASTLGLGQDVEGHDSEGHDCEDSDTEDNDAPDDGDEANERTDEPQRMTAMG